MHFTLRAGSINSVRSGSARTTLKVFLGHKCPTPLLAADSSQPESYCTESLATFPRLNRRLLSSLLYFQEGLFAMLHILRAWVHGACEVEVLYMLQLVAVLANQISIVDALGVVDLDQLKGPVTHMKCIFNARI